MGKRKRKKWVTTSKKSKEKREQSSQKKHLVAENSESFDAATELNRDYFISLAESRGHFAMLAVSWASLAASAIPTYVFWDWNLQEGVDPWTSPAFLVTFPATVLNASFWLISLAQKVPPIKRFFYRHQIFAGWIFFLFSLNLIYSLFLLLAVILNMEINQLNNAFFLSNLSFFLGVYALFLIINLIWLYRSLNKGFSQDRTNRNYSSKAPGYKSALFLSTFGFVSLGRILSKHFSFNKTLVELLHWLLSYAFSQLSIELAYLVYLKSIDEGYWLVEAPDGEDVCRYHLQGQAHSSSH